jgi:putative ABC transport system substrate-binding protein
MTRRPILIVILTLVLLATPLAAGAQQAGKVYRIGVLSFGQGVPSSIDAAFLDGLRERGWVEGQSIMLERRYARGRADRLPELARDLVREKVDLIVASGASVVREAKIATSAIPIVMAGVHDPVGFGLVASLAHPGGNVTGVADSAGREIEGKRLELLKEAVPAVSRVGVVLDSTSRVDPAPMREAARALGLTLLVSPEAATPEELRAVFTWFAREGAGALYAPETPVNARHQSLIVMLAGQHRLPTMYGSREFVEAGGLMSYGPSYADLFRRVAGYVDKILKGTRPGDLPVEQPTQFELAVNANAAKALGLSPAILARADHVIP